MPHRPFTRPQRPHPRRPRPGPGARHVQGDRPHRRGPRAGRSSASPTPGPNSVRATLHLRDLAVHVKAGVREAGGTPLEFGTIAISDGISMGTEGMRASLVSREVIADSIELVARGHGLDAVVALVGCDKTIPAAVMALARLDIPGVVLYGGAIAPGRVDGHDVTIQDVFEAVGAHAAGRLGDAGLQAIEDAACPGAGACGGQFTANTMALACEFLGISPMGSASVPAVSTRRGPRSARRAGRPRDGAPRARPPPATDHHPRRPRERHHRRRRHRRLDQRRAAPAGDRPRGRRPAGHRRLRSHQPTRRRCSPTSSPAAASPWSISTTPAAVSLVAARLLDAGLLHPDAVTVTGAHDRRGRRGGARDARPGRGPAAAPTRSAPTGGLVILQGQPRAGGRRRQDRRLHPPPSPRPGARLRGRGSGLRRGARRAHRGRRRHRDPQRGAARRPRHARDARA